MKYPPGVFCLRISLLVNMSKIFHRDAPPDVTATLKHVYSLCLGFFVTRLSWKNFSAFVFWEHWLDFLARVSSCLRRECDYSRKFIQIFHVGFSHFLLGVTNKGGGTQLWGWEKESWASGRKLAFGARILSHHWELLFQTRCNCGKTNQNCFGEVFICLHLIWVWWRKKRNLNSGCVWIEGWVEVFQLHGLPNWDFLVAHFKTKVYENSLSFQHIIDCTKQLQPVCWCLRIASQLDI